MIDVREKYNELIASKIQLDGLRAQGSTENFFTALKQLWCCAGLGDNQLMQALFALNRQVDSLGPEVFAGNWFASHYRNQVIDWCAPCGAATQAFQDQYISHCQQQLLNQFIRPRTSLQRLASASFASPAPEPAGFIFHLSRCGSTLISGCMAEIDGANVLSEPPAMTEIMLDANLDCALQITAIKQLLHAQYLAMPHQPQLIIKWNAWDILRWQMIRTAWPEVPVVLLVRDPVEIMASHARQVGRHMAGDPSMAQFHPVFCASTHTRKSGDACFDLLARRVDVLGELLRQMQIAARDPQVMLVDYAELDAQKMLQIAEFFQLSVSVESQSRISARMQYHSKEPGQKFHSDSAQKREYLDSQARRYILDQLFALYQQLFAGPV